MSKQKYWDGTQWIEMGASANKVKITDSESLIDATDVEGALEEIVTDFNIHLADTMPHRFVDGATTYRWGLAVIDGVVNMVYEEVV
jgi:hypothetical protein